MSTESIAFSNSSVFSYSDEESSFSSIGDKINFISTSLYIPTYIGIEWAVRSFAVLSNQDDDVLLRIGKTCFRIFQFVIGSILAISTLPLFLFAKGVHQFGNYFSGRSWSHFDGNQNPVMGKPDSYFSLNIASLPFGLQTLAGMEEDASVRAAQIAELIMKYRPRHLCLQEVSAPVAYILDDLLKDHFRHTDHDIGSHGFLKLESGLYFASQELPLTEIFIPFENEEGIDRGVFLYETEDRWILNTHLSAGDSKSKEEIRGHQLNVIQQAIAEYCQDKPVIVLGDLNIQYSADLESEYKKSNLESDYIDPFHEENPEISEQTATCTGLLSKRLLGNNMEPDWEWIDYALIKKGSEAEQLKFHVELVETFELNDPSKASSDHRALYLEVSNSNN